MERIDLIIVLLYLVSLFSFAIWIGKRNTLETYLVAGRKFGVFFLVFTMLSTMVGVTTLVAVSSAAYSSGISFALMSLVMILVGYFVVGLFSRKIKKFGDENKAHTIGDYLDYRYSKRTRVAGSLTIIISYFIFFAALILALSQLLKFFGGSSLLLSLAFALLGVIIYTTIAGIKSDFYTDVIHFFVMFISLTLIMIPVILKDAGGVSAVFSDLPNNFLRYDNFSGASFFWLAIIFGFPLFLLYMEIWQRIYASYSERVVRLTLLYSALLTIPFVFVALLVGLVARKVLPDINPDESFGQIMKLYLSPGLLGFAVAGFIAAILSTLNSVMMVISASFIKDIYISFLNKKSSEENYLKVGRVITFSVGIIGIALAYVFPNVLELSVAANEGLTVLAPAIVGGLIWKRQNEKAGFYSIFIGLIILWSAYPFLQKMSFIPAFLISTAIYLYFSLKNKS